MNKIYLTRKLPYLKYFRIAQAAYGAFLVITMSIHILSNELNFNNGNILVLGSLFILMLFLPNAYLKHYVIFDSEQLGLRIKGMKKNLFIPHAQIESIQINLFTVEISDGKNTYSVDLNHSDDDLLKELKTKFQALQHSLNLNA